MDEIRHLVHRLLKLQQKTGTEEELTRVRHKLNQTYDAYVKRYGHLTNMGNKVFREDADYPLLCALEIVEKDQVRKADIFFTAPCVDRKWSQRWIRQWIPSV